MSDANKHLVQGERHEDTVVLKIQVDQIRDSKTSTSLSGEMITLVDQKPTKNVVIDLSSVSFIGSIGFLALMGLRRHLSNPRIVLCGLSKHVKEAFQVSKLIGAGDGADQGMFDTAETVQQAQTMIDAGKNGT